MLQERETLADNESRARWFIDTFLFFGLSLDNSTKPYSKEDVTFVQTSDDEGFAQVTMTMPSGEVYHVEVTAVQ